MDDDKVVVLLLCYDIICELWDEVYILVKVEKFYENDEYFIFWENLVLFKNSVDVRVLDFLKKVFEFDFESNDLCEDNKKVVYEMI